MRSNIGIGTLAALGIGAISIWSNASATPPPPQARDVAVTDGLKDLNFLDGSWEGDESAWPKRHVTRVFAFEFGAVYTRQFFRRGSLWQPLLTLTFDAKTGHYKLFSPISGGAEWIDVTHPDANTIMWVTHPDGPAIRTTIVRENDRLRESTALIDVDGELKPEGEVLLVRTGPAHLVVSTQDGSG